MRLHSPPPHSSFVRVEGEKKSCQPRSEREKSRASIRRVRKKNFFPTTYIVVENVTDPLSHEGHLRFPRIIILLSTYTGPNGSIRYTFNSPEPECIFSLPKKERKRRE